MRKAILLAAALLMISSSAAMAQERPPLAMEIELQWTAIGGVGGAVMGFMIWLTDPANPNQLLGESLAAGFAWGLVGGAAFGVVRMQQTVNMPRRFVSIPPPAAKPQISSDPVAAISGERTVAALSTGSRINARAFRMPVFNFRF
ncbi:MAG: hypothetical protein OEZ59_10290 [Deltaproteobacteria bacterium]|nr:hypothetical protein [Deltaproteobacteria bacterium]